MARRTLAVPPIASGASLTGRTVTVACRITAWLPSLTVNATLIVPLKSCFGITVTAPALPISMR